MHVLTWGGTLALLHHILTPSCFGLKSIIDGGVTGWIIDFKASSAVQPTNQSMLPQSDHGILVLAIKAPPTQKL